MEPSELLRFLVAALDRLTLRYFITGSTVTIFFGEPRLTNDIDVVVDLSEDDVPAFCRQFPGDAFYLSEEAVRDAIARRSQFNVIHPASGLKIDVMIPAANEFNASRFRRARRVQTGVDWDAPFASPEDAIIMKLVYYKEGGSDKHLRDIAGVLKTSTGEIDLDYIDRWAKSMGLGDIWRNALKRVKEGG